MAVKHRPSMLHIFFSIILLILSKNISKERFITVVLLCLTKGVFYSLATLSIWLFRKGTVSKNSCVDATTRRVLLSYSQVGIFINLRIPTTVIQDVCHYITTCEPSGIFAMLIVVANRLALVTTVCCMRSCDPKLKLSCQIVSNSLL